MSLLVSLRNVGDVTVMDLTGKLIIGEGAVQFRDEVKSLLSHGQGRILVNCGGLTHVDSTGLGEFVSAYTAAHERKGGFKLLNLNGRVQDLLSITRLNTVLEAFDDETAAVRSF